MNKAITQIFLFLLLTVLLLSFYMFIATIVYKSTAFKGIFSTWQFPMLLALFLDASFIE
jgi:hypothetical protein|uniref:Uncharacterized protein n=1 Tax=viral metagenome TaxID=1070528 RepID=A0A6C0KIU1_9ZZZZ